MKTMQKDSMMPAIPTTQVSRRKRITPKMFCRHGRYTPMKVPMRGACKGGQHQPLPCLLITNCLSHASSVFLPCLSSLAVPLPSLFPQVLTPFSYSLPASRTPPSCSLQEASPPPLTSFLPPRQPPSLLLLHHSPLWPDPFSSPTIPLPSLLP